MFGKTLFVIGLAAAGLLLALLNLTTPSTSGAAGILGVFLLGYVVMLVVVTFSLWFISRIIIRLSAMVGRKTGDDALSIKKSYYYASVIALAPVILVSLQSVGGAGMYEVALIGLFVVLGCVYIARRTS